jgi:hypothetical protein
VRSEEFVVRYLRSMCDQAGWHAIWLPLAGSTAPCIRSGPHRRASIKNVIVTNDSNPFQLYGGDGEQPPGRQALNFFLSVRCENPFLGITSIARIQVAVVTLHA